MLPNTRLQTLPIYTGFRGSVAFATVVSVAFAAEMIANATEISKSENFAIKCYRKPALKRYPFPISQIWAITPQISRKKAAAPTILIARGFINGKR